MRRLHRYAPYARILVVSLLLLVLALGVSIAPDAAAADKGKEPTRVKELTEKRTENSKTYLLSDGKLQCEIYSGPINFQDETGAWREIDTTLVPDRKGKGLRAKATPFDVEPDEGCVQLAPIIGCTDRTEAYYQLVTLFMGGTEALRDEVSKGWDFGVDWAYPDARKIACSVGESHSSHESAVACLAHHAIAEMEQRD